MGYINVYKEHVVWKVKSTPLNVKTGVFQAFQPAISDRIEHAYLTSLPISDDCLSSVKRLLMGSTRYSLSFYAMTITNQRTLQVHSIKRTVTRSSPKAIPTNALEVIFSRYANAKNVMDLDSLRRFQLHFGFTSLDMLLLRFVCQCSSYERLTHQEFVIGLARQSIATEKKLVLLKAGGLLSRVSYDVFYHALYFMLKKPSALVLPTKLAIDIWKIVLKGRFRLLPLFTSFMSSSIKTPDEGISYDTWHQTYALSRVKLDTIDLSNSSFPTILDEFIESLQNPSLKKE